MKHNMRAAVIGCGGIGRKHAAAYAAIHGVDLVAGADPSDRRKGDYLQIGVKSWYESAEAMLEAEQIDLVSICTPPAAHAEATIVAAEAGVSGIICEKPMAMNLDECDAMIEACDRHGVKLAIGHQRRYGRQFITALELLASGALGEPLSLWGATPGADIMLWGVHWLDMFNFLMPDDRVASAVGHVDVENQRVTSHGFVEDSLLGHLTFRSGVRAILECGDLAEPAAGQSRDAVVRILGTAGTFSATDLGYAYATPDEAERVRLESPFEADSPDTADQMWIDQAQELIDCIENDTQHQCDGHAGRKTIETTMAIRHAAVTNTRIALPYRRPQDPLEVLRQT